ncbi:hypothetical protein [Plantactinospora sp. CA-290183]|uniref:hypothetical protein n=1 Tax=Plantactinospora sp. CA-290183 TaxID=3240006 RepID=UPI003D92E1C8
MTSQPGPAPSDAPQASQVTKPLRELIAFVLIGANALLLFAAVIDLLVPNSDDYTDRARYTAGSFIGLTAIVLPVLAVLLATHVQPPVPRAKVITVAALAEYGVSAFFGLITIFPWLIDTLAEARFKDFFLTLLSRTALVALFGVAAFVVYRVWRTLYHVPKPKRQPGLYGQPQPYGHPGQGYPGYPPVPGQQPGYPPAGYPQGPAQSTTYGSPTVFGQPIDYGTPASFGQPGYGAPPTSAPPTSAPPTSAPPTSAPPTSAPPAPAPSSAPPAPASAPPAAPSPAPPVPAAPASAPPASAPPASPSPASSSPSPAGTEDEEAERTQVLHQRTGSGSGPADERTQRINPASQQPSAGARPPAPEADDDPTQPPRQA